MQIGKSGNKPHQRAVTPEGVGAESIGADEAEWNFPEHLMREQFSKMAPSSGNPVEPEMNPSDELPPGLPGTDEAICPKCNGSGVRDDGARCDHCAGTGKMSTGHVHP